MTVSARYPIPAGRHQVEQNIDRSRFICTVQRAESVESAHAFIREMEGAFSDATHNCWAYVAGPPGSSSHIGMSDDGEPHGTAGRPMLTILSHSGIGEIVAVVTRYYGGIKLGTGGLARAYSSSVQLALEALPMAERVDWTTLRVTIAYSQISAVQLLIPTFDGVTVREEFGSDVQIELRVPAPQLGAFRGAFGDATRGQGVLEVCDPK